MKLRALVAFGVGLLIAASSCSEQKSASTEGATKMKAKPTAVSNNASQGTNSSAAAAEYAKMTFEETQYNFGNIQQGEKVSHTFKFTNEGKAPLLISDIKTSCGCTTPSYTKTPVKPGEQGEIEVQFNSAGKSGIQNKNITIIANVEGGSSRLLIKGNVEKASQLDGPFKKNTSK